MSIIETHKSMKKILSREDMIDVNNIFTKNLIFL